MIDLSELIGKLRSSTRTQDEWQAADELERLQSQIDKANDRIAELNHLAYGWMDAHDRRAAGKPYDYPSPVDLPESLQREQELQSRLDACFALLKQPGLSPYGVVTGLIELRDDGGLEKSDG